MTSEDRAEQDNLRRFLRFIRLQREVDAAARVAEARRRLEAQLVYGTGVRSALDQSLR